MKVKHHILLSQGDKQYSFTVGTPKDITPEKLHEQIFGATAKGTNPDWDGSPEGALKFACEQNGWEYNEPVCLVIPEGFF